MNRKFIAIAAALTLATCLDAQTVLPFEQTYGPYAVPKGGTVEHEVVPNAQGALLVWSEELNRQAVIRFGLLDRNGRLVSELNTITAPLGADSLSPAVATDGSSFLLAWIELTYGPGYETPRLLALRIDETGRPIGVPRELLRQSAAMPHEKVTRVSWTGSAFEVWGPLNSHFRIHSDDQVEDLSPGGIPYARIGNEFLRAGWTPVTWYPPCGTPLCNPETMWVLGWTSGTFQGQYQPAAPMGPLSAAGGGSVQLIAWLTEGGLALVRIEDDRVISEELIPSTATSSAPGIAFDGSNYLLVYLSAPGELTGMSLSADGKASTPFPIGLTDWVYDLEVDAIAAGRFLVSYRTIAGGSVLHGKIVVTEPSRRRAVR